MTKVAITGASGLVGQNLLKFLPESEYEIVTIGRGAENDVRWDPDRGEIDDAALDGVDVMIHLAGESIAEKRWTDKQKNYLIENRSRCAKLVAEICNKQKINTVLVASAVGFYGHRPDEKCTEESTIGQGFTCDICSEIEGTFQTPAFKNKRVVLMRFGVVMSHKGGALPKMALPVKLFAGGPVGDGRQIVSWVDVDDVCLAILHILKKRKLEGVVNVTSPEPVSNAVMGQAIAQTLRRPFWLPLPKFMVKIMLGEMGQALLLDSCEVYPEKLTKSGFHFSYPSLKSSLNNIYK